MRINLASKIAKVCPNARFGYNNEGLAYLKQMQQIYKNNNGMINYRGYVQNDSNYNTYSQI